MDYLRLMRPKHYIKNLLIFLPLIFSGMLFNEKNLSITILGFFAFCLVSSVIHILNDIKDVKLDRLHHIKKNRPIASGKVSIKNALILATLLLIVVVMLVIYMHLSMLSVILLLLYFLLNIAYSFWLKNIPLVDIVILVSGFLLRVLFGSTIINIPVSNWLYLTIISVSFYLGLGKRRNEIIKTGSNTRKVLQYYTKDFLDKNMYMFLTMAIIFYSLWTTDKGNDLLIWSIPLVIIIALKYSMVIEGNSDGDPVDVILKDKIIIILGIILSVFLFIILYV